MLSSTDKEKLLKLLLIFVCLLLAMGGLSLYHRKNSRTLADLEKEVGLEETAGTALSENETVGESGASNAGGENAGASDAGEDEDSRGLDATETGDRKPENGSYPVELADGFSYEPLESEVYLGLNPALLESIPLEDLFLARIKYVDFSGTSRKGELLCHRSVAGAVTEIFYELYRNDYQLYSVTTAADFDMSYEELLSANKSFCLALGTGDGGADYHIRGLAVQLNPLYNPVVRLDPDSLQYQVLPREAGTFTNREADFPYKIDDNDLAYRLFTEHGFVWGGNRNASKAYGQFVYPDK